MHPLPGDFRVTQNRARLMQSRITSTSWTVVGAIALTGALTLAPIGLGLLSPAAAHSEITTTNPASGATLTTPPRQVVLTFNEEIKDVGDGIVVTAPDGARLDSGEAVIKGTKATQALKPLAIAGAHTVRYRIVSADGHVVSSQYTFTYRPATSATTSSSASPEATAEPSATPVSAEDDLGSAGSNNAAPFIIGGLVVVIVGGSAIALRRRQGSTS